MCLSFDILNFGSFFLNLNLDNDGNGRVNRNIKGHFRENRKKGGEGFIFVRLAVLSSLQFFPRAFRPVQPCFASFCFVILN